MDEATKEKIQQLQLLEQSMQNFLMQKQQFQGQLLEIESALKELDNTSISYKIIGSVMINKNPEELKEELKEKKSTVELRIKTLEEQENKLKDKAQSMQSEVMETLQNKGE